MNLSWYDFIMKVCAVISIIGAFIILQRLVVGA